MHTLNCSNIRLVCLARRHWVALFVEPDNCYNLKVPGLIQQNYYVIYNDIHLHVRPCDIMWIDLVLTCIFLTYCLKIYTLRSCSLKIVVANISPNNLFIDSIRGAHWRYIYINIPQVNRLIFIFYKLRSYIVLCRLLLDFLRYMRDHN